MARRGVTSTPDTHYRVMNFSGGLNSADAPGILADNEASDLLNVVLSQRGPFEQRPALRIDDSFPLPPSGNPSVTGIYDFHRRNSTKERLVFYADGSALSMTSSGTLPVQFGTIDASDVITTVEIFKFDWSFFTYNDKMYAINDKDGLFVYEGLKSDSAGNAYCLFVPSIGTIPKCQFALVHHNRVFYAGDPLQTDRFYYSQLGNPESVASEVSSAYGSTTSTGGGIIDVHSPDTAITGLGVFMDTLIIFKLNSAYSLSGYTPDSDFKLQKINVADGCVNHNTITVANNFLYYLSQSGLHYLYSPFQSSIEVQSLSEKINPSLETLDYSKCHSVYYRNQYYLFYADGAFIYDETIKSWTRFDTTVDVSFVDYQSEKVCMGGKLGYVYRFDKNLLNDEYEPEIERPIRSYYETRYFDLSEPELRKRLKFLKIFYKPQDGAGEIQITQEINYREQQRLVDASYYSLVWGQLNWGDTWWGAPVEMMEEKVTIGGQGEFVRYRFYNDKMNQGLRIYGFVIGYKRKSKVR